MISKKLITQGVVYCGLCLGVLGRAETTDSLTPPKSLCTVAASLDNRGKTVYFTQQTFEKDVQELAIIALDEQQAPIIKRVTYHQKLTENCHFPAIAIIRAGQWGWFLAWAHEDKAYYTRMDSEALVFPPPKVLPVAQVTEITFLPNSDSPTMRLLTKSGETKLLVSDDEGRNWQVTPP